MRTVHFGGLALVGVTLTLASACSSTSHASNAPANSPPAASGAATVVQTMTGDLGTFLTDGAGRTLYLWAADTAGKSTCSGGCAQAWPPLLTSSNPSAGNGVDASKLGTTKRGDGSTQVTYGGHPLYYFVQDKATGDALGQGSAAFGAKWWVVGTSGSAITGSNAATPTTGYTY